MEKAFKNFNAPIEPSNPVSENGEYWPNLKNQALVQNEMRKKFSIIARTSEYLASLLFTTTLLNDIN